MAGFELVQPCLVWRSVDMMGATFRGTWRGGRRLRVNPVSVAAIQFDPEIGNIARNIDAVAQAVAEAASMGAQLVVAPEASTTGYCFESREEALSVARRTTLLAVDAFRTMATSAGVHLICGTIEEEGGTLFNTAVIVRADGRIWSYRKAHLPRLGVDRFVQPGSEPPLVIDLGNLRVGVLICYELRFPEVARTCALDGADLIAIPTNWPVGVDFHPDLFMPARAAENHCYVLAADRIGSERGTQFMGRSRIVDYDGVCLAEASSDRAEIIMATIDPLAARRTRVVLRDGAHEWDTRRDRRPELYGRLTES